MVTFEIFIVVVLAVPHPRLNWVGLVIDKVGKAAEDTTVTVLQMLQPFTRLVTQLV